MAGRRYAHMSQINVSPGQRVSGGSPLGLSGVTGYTTGHHLHFEIRTFPGARESCRLSPLLGASRPAALA